jgi:hypothetical protein
VVEAEVQTGRKVKCVRMDLSGEFDNTVILGFCAEWGIHVEKVPKASSAANGHVERGNRTVIEGTRTQLIDSSMSHRFWAEAVAAHCYVRGFIPSSRHPDVVPWVAWFQQKDGNGNLVKLNVSHLRVWGSKCWVKDLDHVEGKLGNQGWEGRMVGYMGDVGIASSTPNGHASSRCEMSYSRKETRTARAHPTTKTTTTHCPTTTPSSRTRTYLLPIKNHLRTSAAYCTSGSYTSPS